MLRSSVFYTNTTVRAMLTERCIRAASWLGSLGSPMVSDAMTGYLESADALVSYSQVPQPSLVGLRLHALEVPDTQYLPITSLSELRGFSVVVPINVEKQDFQQVYDLIRSNSAFHPILCNPRTLILYYNSPAPEILAQTRLALQNQISRVSDALPLVKFEEYVVSEQLPQELEWSLLLQEGEIIVDNLFRNPLNYEQQRIEALIHGVKAPPPLSQLIEDSDNQTQADTYRHELYRLITKSESMDQAARSLIEFNNQGDGSESDNSKGLKVLLNRFVGNSLNFLAVGSVLSAAQEQQQAWAEAYAPLHCDLFMRSYVSTKQISDQIQITQITDLELGPEEGPTTVEFQTVTRPRGYAGIRNSVDLHSRDWKVFLQPGASFRITQALTSGEVPFGTHEVFTKLTVYPSAQGQTPVTRTLKQAIEVWPGNPDSFEDAPTLMSNKEFEYYCISRGFRDLAKELAFKRANAEKRGEGENSQPVVQNSLTGTVGLDLSKLKLRLLNDNNWGQPTPLDSIEASRILVMFTATHCAPCKALANAMNPVVITAGNKEQHSDKDSQNLWTKNNTAGFELIFIYQDFPEELEKVQKTFIPFGPRHRAAAMSAEDLQRLGVTSFPTLMSVDGNKVVRWVGSGFRAPGVVGNSLGAGMSGEVSLDQISKLILELKDKESLPNNKGSTEGSTN